MRECVKLIDLMVFLLKFGNVKENRAWFDSPTSFIKFWDTRKCQIQGKDEHFNYYIKNKRDT